MFRNAAGDLADIDAAGEFKTDLADAGKEQLKLRIQIKRPRSLYGKDLNGAIGH